MPLDVHIFVKKNWSNSLTAKKYELFQLATFRDVFHSSKDAIQAIAIVCKFRSAAKAATDAAYWDN